MSSKAKLPIRPKARPNPKKQNMRKMGYKKAVRVESKAATKARKAERDIKFAGYQEHGLETVSKAWNKTKDILSFIEYAEKTLAYKPSTNGVVDAGIARVEDLVAFAVAVTHSSSSAGVLSVIELYMRSWDPHAFTPRIKDFIVGWFKVICKKVRPPKTREGANLCPGYKEQAGAECDSVSFQDVIQSLRLAMKDWKEFQRSPFMANGLQLVNLLVTLGYFRHLPEEGLNVQGMQLFSKKAFKIQTMSGDFMQAIAETALFFLERGYAAISTGDFRALYTEDDVLKLEKRYTRCLMAKTILDTDCGDELKSKCDFEDTKALAKEVEDLLEAYRKLTISHKDTMAARIASDRMLNLNEVRVAIGVDQRRSNIRMKPYAVMIFAGSSKGKTTVNNLVVKTILGVRDETRTTQEYMVSINEADKFMSEYKTHHRAITVDDFCNTKETMYDVAPTEKIIDIVNNVPITALKADIAEKGNVMIDVDAFTVTTNVKDLKAHCFSNEPVSILRRFNLVMTVDLKPEFVDEDGSPNPDMMNESWDAWNITLERVDIRRGCGMSDTYAFRTLKSKVSILEALDFIRTDAHKHFFSQKQYTEKMEHVLASKICTHGRPSAICPVCDTLEAPPPCETIFCKETDTATPQGMQPLEATLEQSCKGLEMPSLLESDERSESSDYSEDDDVSVTGGLCDDPELAALTEQGGVSFEIDSLFNPVSGATNRGDFSQDEISEYLQVPGDSFIQRLQRQWECKYDWDQYRRIAKKAKGTLLEAMKNVWRDHACLVVGSVALSVLIGYCTIHRTKNAASYAEQGNAEAVPTGMEERPPAPGDDPVNPWIKVQVEKTPSTLASQTATAKQVSNLANSSLATIYVGHGNKRLVSLAFPLGGKDWLIPWHLLENGPKQIPIELRGVPKKTMGNQHRCMLDKSRIYRIPGRDLAIIRTTAWPNVDLSRFLPEKPVTTNHAVLMKFKHPETFEQFAFQTRINHVGIAKIDSGRQYEAFSYTAGCKTFEGMCMAPAVTNTSCPVIVGMHLAGSAGTPRGLLGTVTKPEIERGVDILNAASMQIHSAGTLVTEKYDKDFTPTETVHPKHVVNWQLTERPSAVVHGEVESGRVRFKSDVHTSPISKSVTENLGLPRMHGPPPLDCVKKHWHADFEQISTPDASNINTDFLDAAVADVKKDIAKVLDPNTEKGKALLDEIHLYPLANVLAGADGVKSVDSLDLNTSCGFPVNKPKNEYIQESAIPVPGITRPLECDPMFVEEMNRMEQEYLAGRRVYPVFRANLKDEPTKIGKDRIRVFAGCELAFTMLARKYYLSIIRVIQEGQLDFECAVGINAVGKDWDGLAKFLQQNGENSRFVAGDFSKFDKQVCAEFTVAAFDCLIEIARLAGASEDILKVMRGIATDIAFPLYEYDGILVSIFGSNPSGHPLTVIINCFINKLYMRYAYYSKNGLDAPPFSTYIKLATYGDDNCMGISDKLPSTIMWDHSMIAEELAKISINYTMADKDAKSVPYITFGEVDFLKRKFRYADDLGHWVAPIDEMSISKSLHNIMKRRGSVEAADVIASYAIDAAAREYFLYGQETYDTRREQLTRVAKECDLALLVGELPTYSDCVDRFLNDT